MSLLLVLRNHGVATANDAEATWEQAPATWDALAAQTIIATATFEQTQEWEAIAAESFAATAAWQQTQTWSAEGDVDNPPVSFEGSWEQAASWGAVFSGGAVTQPSSGFDSRRPQKIRLSDRQYLYATASFVQEPATWHAEMTVDRVPVDIEEMLVAGVL
jgi:hypothetical protein